MSIYLYSGTAGSGKSCHQAEVCINQLRMGHLVICNYFINVNSIKRVKGEFYEVSNEDISPQWLVKMSEWWFSSHKFREGSINLFIDEAQLLFNSRSWDDKNRNDWIRFFSQHRKYGFDIFIVSQYDRMIDRQIRSMIEYECIHRRFSNGSIKEKILGLMLGGNTYIVVKVWYPLKQQIGAEIHHIRRKYWNLYDSYKFF